MLVDPSQGEKLGMEEENKVGIPTWDLESLNWVTPVAIGFYDGATYRDFVLENEDDDVVWRFLCFLKEHYAGIKLFAHFASKYDNKFVLAALRRHDEGAKLEAGFLRLRWIGPNILFEDSFSLCPMSLERMNKMFGVEEKGIWDHRRTKLPWEMQEELVAFRGYLRTDCISLSHSLHQLCETLGTTFGQVPSISLATTSAKVFDKCFCPVSKIESNIEFEEFIRAADYGGRNEVYKRYGENINLYDIHWMYTSCYDVPVPIGKLRWIKPDINRGTIVEATVSVPKDWYIGPLPHKRNRKLIFGVGTWTDWFDIYDLRNAASMGVDMTLKRQLCCEEEPVLKGFGQFMGSLEGKGKDPFWKSFGISLSGKFGQSRWRDSIKFIDEIKDLRGCTPTDDKEEYFAFKEYAGKGAPYIRPLIYIRIRTEARIRHLKLLLLALETGDIFYCDTDSNHTTATLPTEDKVGGLVHLGKAERGYYIRQKLYGIIRGGRLDQKSAGYSDLKLSEEDFKNLLNGGKIEADISHIPSYRNILNNREVKLFYQGRKIKGDLGDSRMPIGNDTEPILLQEH
jgi:hypothetical protein